MSQPGGPKIQMLSLKPMSNWLAMQVLQALDEGSMQIEHMQACQNKLPMTTLMNMIPLK